MKTANAINILLMSKYQYWLVMCMKYQNNESMK